MIRYIPEWFLRLWEDTLITLTELLYRGVMWSTSRRFYDESPS